MECVIEEYSNTCRFIACCNCNRFYRNTSWSNSSALKRLPPEWKVERTLRQKRQIESEVCLSRSSPGSSFALNSAQDGFLLPLQSTPSLSLYQHAASQSFQGHESTTATWATYTDDIGDTFLLSTGQRKEMGRVGAPADDWFPGPRARGPGPGVSAPEPRPRAWGPVPSLGKL